MTDHTLAEEAAQFIDSAQTVSIATLDSDGNPASSYTPFCRLQNGFGIYISTLADHTQQIIDHPTLSLMWIADEQSSPNPFARQRIIARANAHLHARGSEGFEQISRQMSERFPQMMGVLTTLADFQAFELHITSCRYVKGFGKAYHSETGLLTDLKHIAPGR